MAFYKKQEKQPRLAKKIRRGVLCVNSTQTTIEKELVVAFWNAFHEDAVILADKCFMSQPKKSLAV